MAASCPGSTRSDRCSSVQASLGGRGASSSSLTCGTVATRSLNEAQAAFEAADKALAAGDLGTYQSRIEDAQAATERALRAMGR